MFQFDEKFIRNLSTHAVYVIGELNSVNCVRRFFLEFSSNNAWWLFVERKYVALGNKYWSVVFDCNSLLVFIIT